VNVVAVYLKSRTCVEELKKCEELQSVVLLVVALSYKRVRIPMVPFEIFIDPLLSGHNLGLESTQPLKEMSKAKAVPLQA
jgi:hypothetical protein